MSRVCQSFTHCAVVALAIASLLLLPSNSWAQEQSPLTVTDGVNRAHIVPTVSQALELSPDNGPLLYHSGGPVMTGPVKLYAIYWIPAHLQNGGATSLPSFYQTIQTNVLAYYPAHGIDNNNTQYYQTISGATTYIANSGGVGGSYVDTTPYPASGCNDVLTPGNCITDAQIQTEIQRVMTLEGWTGGINKMYLLFTSSGEGSCMGTSCAYVNYCAYHSFIAGTAPIIYSNEPYGENGYCQIQGVPSPNNDPAADTAATAASHEISEAVTDPMLNAWYSAQGNEIGDLCIYKYGQNSWDGGKANQNWAGRYFELQMEFDNHTNGCAQVGP
jgi:hypothetical protein